MTEERLAEYADIFDEPLDDQTAVWLLGWAILAQKGGHELLAEIGRLKHENAQLKKLNAGFQTIATTALSLINTEGGS